METQNQFRKKGVLIGHDVQNQTLLFHYTGETPTLMGAYYMIHHTELNQLRKEIGNLLLVAQEMADVLNLQEELIEKQGQYLNQLIKSSLKI